MNKHQPKDKCDSAQNLMALSIMSGKPDPYQKYEKRKNLLQSQNLSPREYEKAIRRVAEECNI